MQVGILFLKIGKVTFYANALKICPTSLVDCVTHFIADPQKLIALRHPIVQRSQSSNTEYSFNACPIGTVQSTSRVHKPRAQAVLRAG